MRCSTLRFGCSSVAVQCGAAIRICDRVRAKGLYGIEIDFDIWAQTANGTNFGKI